MGQKINPYGFRLGITTDWKSRWFANGEDYANFIIEDSEIRDFIMKDLPHAAISPSRSSASQLVTASASTCIPHVPELSLAARAPKLIVFAKDWQRSPATTKCS